MPVYEDSDYHYYLQPVYIAPCPVYIDRAPKDGKEKVPKSRSEAWRETQEVIANNRQKYEPTILDLEGKLDSIMHVFDAKKRDPRDQSNKRKAICYTDNAKEHRQRWVNRLDDLWEKYEKE